MLLFSARIYEFSLERMIMTRDVISQSSVKPLPFKFLVVSPPIVVPPTVLVAFFDCLPQRTMRLHMEACCDFSRPRHFCIRTNTFAQRSVVVDAESIFATIETFVDSWQGIEGVFEGLHAMRCMIDLPSCQ